ncbi:VOC family protein [Streptomyces sp. NPDC003077]|uniref:VOC family protein n=1 Tax=Streptomyces sp. NPDC003077 TaxID=3154443 RepID=UPI00339FD213
MLTSTHLPGGPCWLDLTTPDVEGSAAFYGAVFGWRLSPAPQGATDHGLFRLDGKIAASVHHAHHRDGTTAPAASPEDPEAAWTVHFRTPDADVTAKAVERAGGTVRRAPADFLTAARTAHFTDPGGARFAVWEPRDLPGLEVINAPGSASWIELYTTDATAAKDFYRAVFPWNTDWDLPLGAHVFSIVTPTDGDRTTPHCAIMQLLDDAVSAGARSEWHPYFETADCDAAQAAAEAHGATIVVPAIDVPGVGRVATFRDPFRAHFAVMQSPRG